MVVPFRTVPERDLPLVQSGPLHCTVGLSPPSERTLSSMLSGEELVFFSPSHFIFLVPYKLDCQLWPLVPFHRNCLKITLSYFVFRELIFFHLNRQKYTLFSLVWLTVAHFWVCRGGLESCFSTTMVWSLQTGSVRFLHFMIIISKQVVTEHFDILPWKYSLNEHFFGAES